MYAADECVGFGIVRRYTPMPYHIIILEQRSKYANSLTKTGSVNHYISEIKKKRGR